MLGLDPGSKGEERGALVRCARSLAPEHWLEPGRWTLSLELAHQSRCSLLGVGWRFLRDRLGLVLISALVTLTLPP